MKTFKIIYAFMAMFVLAGCNDDADYLPGEPEGADCYGVYFPAAQKTMGDQELDPAQDTRLTFVARRLRSEGAITVPVVLTSDTKEVFKVSAVEFEDGQESTTFDITFDDAEIGTTYGAQVAIEDPAYAGIYGEKSTGFTFSVTRVKWNKVTADGQTMGRWRDDIVSSAYGLPGVYAEYDKVEFWEREDKPGFYRINNVYSPEFMSLLWPPYTPEEIAGNCPGGVMNYIDATDPDKVWLPVQSTGVFCNSGDGVIGFASYVKKNFEDDSSVTADGDRYGKLVNGVITFPKEGLSLELGGRWYHKAGNASELLRIVLPGAKVYDYSLALSNSEPAGGVVKLGFRLGADVAKVKYSFFGGAFTDALAETKSKEMDAGETPVRGEVTATGTVDAVLDETGVYSVVANVYNAKNELQGYEYLSFGYVKDGDEKPVLLSIGLDITDKYADQGYTSEDSAEFWANGQDIESGSYGLYETDALEGKTEADLIALVTDPKAAKFSAKDLEAINKGKGSFSVMLGGLNGGTSYTLVVRAYNGYVSKIVTAEATTHGTPHPLKRQYTVNDLLNRQPTVAGYARTWNYYAVNKNGTSTKRIRVGTVTIAENPANAATVKVSGISGIKPAAIGGSDEMLFEYDGGLLYSLADQIIGTYQGMPVSYWMTDTAFGGYSADYALVGGLVDDGYIAFVAYPGYIQQGITFSGFRFLAFTDQSLETAAVGMTWLYNLMLVDPAKDDMAKSAEIVTAMTEVSAEPANCVELRGPDRLRAVMGERGKVLPVNAAQVAMPVVRSSASAVNARVTFTPGTAVQAPAMPGAAELKAGFRVE